MKLVLEGGVEATRVEVVLERRLHSGTVVKSETWTFDVPVGETIARSHGHEILFTRGAWRLASEELYGRGQTGKVGPPDPEVLAWGHKLCVARNRAAWNANVIRRSS